MCLTRSRLVKNVTVLSIHGKKDNRNKVFTRFRALSRYCRTFYYDNDLPLLADNTVGKTRHNYSKLLSSKESREHVLTHRISLSYPQENTSANICGIVVELYQVMHNVSSGKGSKLWTYILNNIQWIVIVRAVNYYYFQVCCSAKNLFTDVTVYRDM